MPMIQDILGKIGLDSKEQAVYLQLLKNGPSRASTLAYQIKLPRTTVQNILIRLETKEIATKEVIENVNIYTPITPDNLIELLKWDKKEKEYEYDQLIRNLEAIHPALTSLMNSNKNLPIIQFYKGHEGVKEALFETLKSKTEIKGIINPGTMHAEIQDINTEYIRAREKTKLKKRSIMLDSANVRGIYEKGNYSPKTFAEYKWIKPDQYPFGPNFDTETMIYDDKVLFLNYKENHFTGVSIQNKFINEMQSAMWDILWHLLPAN